MDSKVAFLLVLLVVILISNTEAGKSKKKSKDDKLPGPKNTFEKGSGKADANKTKKRAGKAGREQPNVKDKGEDSDDDGDDAKNNKDNGDDAKNNKDNGDDDDDKEKNDDNDDSDDNNDSGNKSGEKKGKKKAVCLPGRTVLKASAGFHPPPEADDSNKNANDGNDVANSSDEKDPLRNHMHYKKEKKVDSDDDADADVDNDDSKDVDCQVCVCAVNGIDEYCSKRPAQNVNECMRIAKINQDNLKHIPFDLERTLAYRIRRGWSYCARVVRIGGAEIRINLIWHHDEIPYAAKAKCVRGASYYTNSVSANNTDIDVADDIDSLLDYSNEEICFFCICSVGGTAAGCIPRDPWFCNYYRYYKTPNAARDMYSDLFKQDAPSYFRSLSFRIRRTMDRQVFELYDSGGDALCCGHPDGHRRTIHNKVRSKMMSLKRRIPKENLMSKSPGGDYVDFIVNND